MITLPSCLQATFNKKKGFVRPVSFGNSVVEYSLIAIFLLLVCGVALQTINKNFSSAMANVKQDMQYHTQSASAALIAEQAASAAAAAATQGMGQQPGLNDTEKSLLQQSLADKIQTTGANGATELLANQMAASAAELLAQGKIDQSQYDILLQLSNQGHKIAEIQGLIASAVNAANGDVSTFNNITLLFQGQTYTAAQLAGMIGVNGPMPEDFASTNILSLSPTDTNTEPELANFLSLYNQALNSGALADPTALATVNSASAQIASLGEVVENSAHFFSTGEAILDASNMSVVQAQQASQMSSSAICKAGDFDDNGVLCTL
jgi:hypothetical protein